MWAMLLLFRAIGMVYNGENPKIIYLKEDKFMFKKLCKAITIVAVLLAIYCAIAQIIL